MKFLKKCNSQNSGLVFILMTLLIASTYGFFIHNPLVFDDVPFFFQHRIYQQISEDGAWSHLRWLPYMSFYWVKNFISADVVWAHLTNDLLHLSNSFLLYLFLKELFFAMAKQGASVLSQSTYANLALFAAVFFLLHPASVYSVTYLVQRPGLTMTFFALTSMYIFLFAIQKHSTILLLLSALGYGFSVHSKEHVIMLPACLLLLCYLLERPSKQLILFLLPGFFLMALFGFHALYWTIDNDVIGYGYEFSSTELFVRLKQFDPAFDQRMAYPLSIVTQCGLFFKYLLIWMIPGPDWLSVDMRAPFVTRLWSLQSVTQVIGLLGYIFVAVYCLLQRGLVRLAGFGLMWPLLMFLTEFSTVRIQDIFVVYRSYIWIIGMFACLPLLWEKFSKIKFLSLLAPFILAGLIPLTWARLHTFSDELYLWDDAAKLIRSYEDIPGVERIFFNRAHAYYEIKLYDKAIADYSTAIKISPNYANAYTNRGIAYAFTGNIQMAIADLQAAITLKGRETELARYNLGAIYLNVHEITSGLENLDQACAAGYDPACQRAKFYREKGY